MSENVGIGRKFEVPDDWDVSTIESNITDIGDGGTPDTSVEHYFGGNIRWAKIEDINFKIGDTENHLTEEGLNNSSAKLWPEGSVIVTTGATIGKVGITQEPIATKQGITGIVTNNNLDSRYFAYYLLSERKSLQRFAQGGTFEEIRPYILKRLRLPLPPIHEQRRIAEILSTVDELIHQTDAVIEQTERLKRGLMQDLLTQGIGHESFQTVQIGPKTHQIPTSWEISQLGEVAKMHKGRSPMPKSDKSLFDGEINWVKISEISKYHKLITDTEETVTKKGAEKSRIFPKGTLVIGIYGASRGGIAILDMKSCSHEGVVGIFSLDDTVDKNYLYYFLSNENLNELGHGAAQKNLNISILKSIYLLSLWSMTPFTKSNKI